MSVSAVCGAESGRDEGQTHLMTAMLTGAYVLARYVPSEAMIYIVESLNMSLRMCERVVVGESGTMFLNDCCFWQAPCRTSDDAGSISMLALMSSFEPPNFHMPRLFHLQSNLK